LVTPGESVKAGQVLAELDSPELESLQLEIRNAQTALNLSLKLRSSAEAAGKTGAIPEIRFIEAKNQVQKDRASLEIARAKWLSLQLPPESLEAMLQTQRTASTATGSEKSDRWNGDAHGSICSER
jgi:cobalt-zinc-cadmium efflux system membrane fusion protein